MAKFKIKEKKHMPKREDGLSSVYNKQTTQEYQRTNKHIQDIWMEVLVEAAQQGQPGVLEQPLKGFPRTKGHSNYSMLDIYLDLDAQYQRGEDYLDSKIGRWNRLMEDFPDAQIEFEIEQPKNNFKGLFKQ
jgi:hypothetical protein